MTYPDPIKLAIPVFMFLIVIEMIVAKKTGWLRYETRDMTTSLMMGFGNSLIGLLAVGLIFTAYSWAYQFRLFDLAPVWWVFIACFLAEDLAYYWFHRISHKHRWFWASHVVHHSSQHYNLSTALRQTWTGKLTGSFIFWLPLCLLGFPPEMVLFFNGVSLVYQFWIHTEAIGRLGPLEWVLNTPSHHRVHHGTNPRYLDANYAGVLIIWDRLFGSFVAEDPAEPVRYGIIKNPSTFNPLRIAFHEWIGIGKDLRHATNVREYLGYLWGPPGWSPDGSRMTSVMIKARAAKL